MSDDHAENFVEKKDIIYLDCTVSRGAGPCGADPPVFGGRRAFVGAACLIGLIVCIDMMVAYTYDTRPVIDGVQGRYFLPLVPLVFAAIYVPKWRIGERLNRHVIMAMSGLQIFVLIRVLTWTIGGGV